LILLPSDEGEKKFFTLDVRYVWLFSIC
jgi:hypothetical protein